MKTQLAWFDRAGKELGRLGQPEDQQTPTISPDQKRVAVARRDPQGETDIWLLELARDTSTRFTFHPGGRFDSGVVARRRPDYFRLHARRPPQPVPEGFHGRSQ